MALAEMCKARIAVHRFVADELAAKLQALGCCEFINRSGDWGHSEAMFRLREKRRHIDELISDVRFLQRLLEPYETKKESSLGKMLGEVPTLTFDQLAARVDEKKFTEFTWSMREAERALTETRSDISRLKGLLAQIVLLESIKYPLEFFTTGTELVGGAVYSVPKVYAPAMAARITKDLGDMVEFQQLSGSEKDPNETFALLYQKSEFEKVQEIASEFGAGRVEVPKDFSLTAAAEKEELCKRISECEEREAALIKELAASADEGLDMARNYGDYWTILRNRMEAMETGVPTEEVLIWEFWLPRSWLRKVKATVGLYDAYTEFAEVAPEEDEEAPTLLKNAPWASCIEPLTIMYGTPTYGKVDPTALMAPFFFVFLGMCFGDGGYGLVVAGILGYFLVKHQLSPTLRKFFVMMTVGMVMSVIMGALTGSWFGDALTAFPFLSGIEPLFMKLRLLDPMNDPMTLLMISLALGFIQVIFGLLIAFKENWKEGNKMAAVSDQGGWIIFLCGLVLTGCSMSGYLADVWALPSKAMAIGGALLLVATQGREKQGIFSKLFSGLLSLYNVTGFLGDVLSYSRLLALGLGSAAVGMVINLLANLVAGVPYVGILLAALIFILGHTFSIVVNLLGAFIHSLRLQYVEFFGKFYNASGRDFTPLNNAAQYSRIQEDSTVIN
ncbi:MAG: V-type ATP synthase subunit I [Synergistaceae bacterium]|nr:V-type ATP synthase subunit I [Synergistaceae bacterium]